MGFAAFLRNFIGAAPQAEVDSARAAMAAAAQAQSAAVEMKALVAQVRDGHIKSVEEVQAELARLSQRVESMPEMRAQLENFVQSLGRTMVGVADRLDTVHDRIERVEQQARSQTEIIALSRAEFDRQGRVLANLEVQMKSLEDAIRHSGNIEWDANLRNLLNMGKITHTAYTMNRMNEEESEEMLFIRGKAS